MIEKVIVPSHTCAEEAPAGLVERTQELFEYGECCVGQRFFQRDRGGGEYGAAPRPHGLHQVPASGGIATGVVAKCRRRHRELASDVREHGVGLRFAGLERTAGMAKVEEHERVAQPVGVASLGHGLRQAVGSQPVVAGDLALVGRRRQIVC